MQTIEIRFLGRPERISFEPRFLAIKHPDLSGLLNCTLVHNLSIRLCTIVNDVRAFFCENPEISIPLLRKPPGRKQSAHEADLAQTA